MTVKCEIKTCRAERPVSEMQVRKQKRGGVLTNVYRCKCHYGFVNNLVKKHQQDKRKCRFCRRSMPRVKLEPYSVGFNYRCKDKEECATSSSLTTST